MLVIVDFFIFSARPSAESTLTELSLDVHKFAPLNSKPKFNLKPVCFAPFKTTRQWLCFLQKSAIPDIFFFIFVFSIQLTVNK